MDNSTQRDEMLMRYIDGLMSADEKTEFEKLLSADAVLQNSLENLQLSIAAVKTFGLKQEVAAVHGKMIQELRYSAPVKNISSGRRLVRRIVAVAASVVFIFLAVQGWVFYNLSATKVYYANYIQYVPDEFRNGEQKVTVAQQAYQEKQYKKVIQIAAQSGSINDNFLAAHSQLALNNSAAAVNGFTKVIEQTNSTNGSELKDAAEYNLVLSYILNKDYDFALELMNKIKSNSQHLYQDKMTGKLFRQVKMLKWR